MPYWRASRERLHAGLRVTFPDMTVVQGWWIEPRTQAVVMSTADDGITVRLLNGEYEKETVKVDPQYLAYGGITAVSAAAYGWDGKVVEVAPGIGVEVLITQDDRYARFIAGLLEQIAGSHAGARLLGTFDPAQNAFPFEAGRPFAISPYAGLTVLITQPRPKYNTRVPVKTVYPLIKTADVGVRTGDYTRNPGGNKIPLISFFDKPAPGGQPVEIGGPNDATVTPQGIAGHRDFPGAVQDFDVVLYHELVHAYLSNCGVGGRLRQARVAQQFGNPDQSEEELVTGLLAGRGHVLAENAYRLQTGRPLRTTYLAVQINDPGVQAADWNPPGVSLTDAISRWIAVKGISPADARWLATGV
jgi:hypothetical protein